MNNLENIFGLLFIGVAIVFLLFFTFRKRQRASAIFRTIPAFKRLNRAIGLAVEEGKRVHLSLGSASLPSALSSTALAGLGTLDRISQLSSVSDRPPIATSGHGSLSILSKDTFRSTYQAANTLRMFDPDRGRLTGVTPFSYAVGTMPVMSNENISANIIMGNFGPEIAYLCEASDRQNAFLLAGSDSLTAQAVLYVAADQPLIGEEVFAVPAYLEGGASHTASLQVQDILRWVLIGLILVGALINVILSLVGGPII